jgi:hypothetical protein
MMITLYPIVAAGLDDPQFKTQAGNYPSLGKSARGRADDSNSTTINHPGDADFFRRRI